MAPTYAGIDSTQESRVLASVDGSATLRENRQGALTLSLRRGVVRGQPVSVYWQGAIEVRLWRHPLRQQPLPCHGEAAPIVWMWGRPVRGQPVFDDWEAAILV